MKKLSLLLFCLLILGIIFFYFNRKPIVKNVPIDFIVVTTRGDQEKGLSGLSSLPFNTGMLFKFERPGIYAIWMKDMLFSIDILWLDEKFKITHIETNVSPSTYPKTFSNKIPSSYVLETEENFVQKNDLHVGNILHQEF
jgi:uncharacterized membrane protein (UPF0127 family)